MDVQGQKITCHRFTFEGRVEGITGFDCELSDFDPDCVPSLNDIQDLPIEKEVSLGLMISGLLLAGLAFLFMIITSLISCTLTPMPLKLIVGIAYYLAGILVAAGIIVFWSFFDFSLEADPGFSFAFAVVSCLGFVIGGLLRSLAYRGEDK